MSGPAEPGMGLWRRIGLELTGRGRGLAALGGTVGLLHLAMLLGAPAGPDRDPGASGRSIPEALRTAPPGPLPAPPPSDSVPPGPLEVGLLLLAVALPAMTLAGVVSTDVAEGRALLWLQKPVDPVGYYLVRAGEAMAAALLALLASGAIMTLVAWPLDPAAAAALPRRAPIVVLAAIPAGMVALTLSSWGVRRASLLTLALVLGSMLLESEVRIRSDAFGALAGPLRWATAPVAALRAAAVVLGGGRGPELELWLALAGWGVVWAGLTVLGIRRTTRSPLPRSATR